MKPGRPSAGALLSKKTRPREPHGAAGGDFAWPPPADDPAACSIVMLEGEAGPAPRPRLTVPADESFEAFPDIDIEAALDAFADTPVAARAAPATRLALLRIAPMARPLATGWWSAALRTFVALGIGASLALMPPPGFTPTVDARPLAVPAPATPRMVTPRRIRTPDRVRVSPRPVTEPSQGPAMPRDEERIRTTLAKLRAAYSQLDADAAREVWPSVDVDALARAFDGLKSQELRFDHCDVTVDGARARAACIGEAVYVPRIGDHGSSSAARAWTFELSRWRERWTIASARASSI